MNASVYVISCPLGLLKVAVAAEPKRRLQNLQVGSPVPLELAAQYPMSDLASAQAVAAALNERFRARRERGHWFRASPLELRQALGEREIVDLYRRSEAGYRAQARAAAEAAKAEARRARALATAAERRRLRRARRRAAAQLLGAGLTQVATAEALGLSDRTLRNWLKGQSFQTAVERARARAERQASKAERSVPRRRAAQEQEKPAPELPSEQDPARVGRVGQVLFW